MKPSLPAADLMNSDDSIFSADSGEHQEFVAGRDPQIAGTRSSLPLAGRRGIRSGNPPGYARPQSMKRPVRES
jgi:hypothetical protein